MTYSFIGMGAASAPTLPSFPTTLTPTIAELKGDLGPIIEVVNAVPPPRGFNPRDPETWKPDAMIPWGVDTIMALQKHLGFAPIDLSQALAIAKGELKWLDEYGIPLTSIPMNVRDAALLFARTSAVAACRQLGIPPELGTATVDALSDGEFTSADVESIGGVAGGMGGSYLCGMIGIPPQLGGFVGSFAGKLVGGLVSDALNIGGGSSEREARLKAEKQARAAVRKQLNTIRNQYSSLVMPLIRNIYWQTFDNMLGDIEELWQISECSTGTDASSPMRFPLLWGSSGMLSGLPSNVDPFLRRPFDASRCPPLDYTLSQNPALCLQNSWITPGNASGCPSVFGCPYPSFPNLGAAPAERVAQAFAAHNMWWVQGQNRDANTKAWQENLPHPPSSIVNDIARWTERKSRCASDACRRGIDGDIEQAVKKYDTILQAYVAEAGPTRLFATGMLVQSDIIASASVYAVANSIRANAAQLRSGKLDRFSRLLAQSPAKIQSAERKAKAAAIAGTLMNGALNVGVPALGALLIYKGIRGRR